MDPIKLLAEIRALRAQLTAEYERRPDRGYDDEAVAALLEKLENLDEWMARGGFSPWAEERVKA